MKKSLYIAWACFRNADGNIPSALGPTTATMAPCDIRCSIRKIRYSLSYPIDNCDDRWYAVTKLSLPPDHVSAHHVQSSVYILPRGTLAGHLSEVNKLSENAYLSAISERLVLFFFLQVNFEEFISDHRGISGE